MTIDQVWKQEIIAEVEEAVDSFIKRNIGQKASPALKADLYVKIIEQLYFKAKENEEILSIKVESRY